MLGTERKLILQLLISEGGRFPAIAEFYHREVVSRGLRLIRTALAPQPRPPCAAGRDAGALSAALVAPLILAVVWDRLFGRIDPLDVEGMLAAHAGCWHAAEEGPSHERTRPSPLSPALCLIAGAAALCFSACPAAHPRFHGWVEADLLFIGADEAGRLTSLAVSEGETVKAGAPLFQLQSDIQDADLHQARAALEEARARLAQAEAAQQRPEEIAVLRAQEARAQAALEQSEPELERTRKLVERNIAAQARLDQAKAAFERDKAQLNEVRRQIEVAGLKARAEDIEAAQGVMRQAEARLASAETRLAQRNVTAPAAGIVQEIYFRSGEIVTRGPPGPLARCRPAISSCASSCPSPSCRASRSATR